MFVYVIPIILGVRLLPLCVFLVEFILIVRRQLVTIAAIVVGRIIVVSWRRRRDFIP